MELARIRWELARSDFQHDKQMCHGFPSQALATRLREARKSLESAMILYEQLVERI